MCDEKKKMNILIAPDSFKGSLTAEQVCAIIEEVATSVIKESQCFKLPISDGGEGLVESLLSVKGGSKITCKVKGPLGTPVLASYGILPDKTAVIEMAAASGLTLVPKDQRNPLLTSTFGTGELIADAAAKGCERLILGIGGSATHDGGMGAASALGIRFIDAKGKNILPNGEQLHKVKNIDDTNIMPEILEMEMIIACDVNNPLCGEWGSAAVYAPQKGADTEMVKFLDKGLGNLGQIIKIVSGKDLREMSGIGAAGGMALPFVAFMNAKLRSGLDIVLDFLEFEKYLEQSNLVITGEGKTDDQSAMGKVLSGVCQRAKEKNIPVIAISGALGKGYESLYKEGLTAAFATCTSVKPLDWQMEHAEENLKQTAYNIFKLLSVSGIRT